MPSVVIFREVNPRALCRRPRSGGGGKLHGWAEPAWYDGTWHDGKSGMRSGRAGPVNDAPHIPVLIGEIAAALMASRGGVFIDGTFGAGGYTRAILDASPSASVIAIDRDPSAIAGGAGLAAASNGRLRLVEGEFGDLDRIAAAQTPDGLVEGVVLDIGVSSMQIDEAGRGFSFRLDGPLDMRMAQSGRSAADIVNTAPEAELADIFFHFGEERRARAVARAIVAERGKTPFTTTNQLAALVARFVRAEPGLHPATRVFQALRIAVNDELGQLLNALYAAERCLRSGGRLAVVTFHSLEDRIVKQFMALRCGRVPGASRHAPAAPMVDPSFIAVTKKPIVAGEAEIAGNPRARSAKLRVAERTSAVVQDSAPVLSILASLPGERSHPRRVEKTAGMKQSRTNPDKTNPSRRERR